MRTRTGSSIVVLSFATFVVVLYWTTRNWQLVSDAALIRYATFLLSNGFAPYRQLTDINLPGSYLLDWAALHLFGAGRFGLRLYDLSLLVAAGAAMVIIAPRKQRSDALCAACLFALFHGRDGATQLGQRDLAIAALLLVAIAELTLFVLFITGSHAGNTKLHFGSVAKGVHEFGHGDGFVTGCVFWIRHIGELL